MNETLLILLIVLLSQATNFAQSEVRYNLANAATISIPDGLEPQSKDYAAIGAEYAAAHGIKLDESRIVFQQSGLNDSNSPSFKRYVRIIHEIVEGSMGEFPHHKDDPDLSVAELEELNKYLYNQFKSSLGPGQNMLSWNRIKVEKIGESYCLHISYIRQLADNPKVQVDRYSFFNYDKIQNLTMSYRIIEEDLWKNLLKNSLITYKIL